MNEEAIQVERPQIASTPQARDELEPTRLFQTHALACFEAYLLRCEGPDIAAVLSEDYARLVIEFSRNETVQAGIAQADRRKAAEALRESLDGIIAGLRDARSGGLDFLPAATPLLRAMSAEPAVQALDILMKRIGPVLTRRQFLVMLAAIREVRRSIDRLAVRSTLHDPSDVVTVALAAADLNDREDTEQIETGLSGWLRSWARMRPSHHRVSDFEFFRRFIHSLDAQSELTSEEWRALARHLAYGLEDHLPGGADSGSFMLFRMLARSGNRVAFVRKLRTAHARAFRILDPELLDWLLVLTLIGESQHQATSFVQAIDSDRLRENLDLEPEELREFFAAFISKIRREHERYELDWFQQATDTLCDLLVDLHGLNTWEKAAAQQAKGLASSIAADSSESVRQDDIDQTIRQLNVAIVRSVAFTESAGDAVRRFRDLAAILPDCDQQRKLWRNTQRISANLQKVDRSLTRPTATRLTAVLESLSAFDIRQAPYDAEPRRYWNDVALQCIWLSGALIDRSLGAQVSSPAGALVEYAANEVFTGRADLNSVESFFSPQKFDDRAIALGYESAQAAALREAAAPELGALRLWRQRAELSATLAGSDDSAAQHFQRILALLSRLPGGSMPRVEEEWQIWVVPEVHWLLESGFPPETDSWPALLHALEQELSPRQLRGMSQFFRSLLGSGHVAKSDSAVQSAVSDLPLAPEKGLLSGTPSEPFQYAVEDFRNALIQANAPDWLLGFGEALASRGDAEAAWQDTANNLQKALEAQGFTETLSQLDQVRLRLARSLPALPAAFWVEELARARELAQQLEIGLIWTRHAHSLAEQSAAAASLEGADAEEASARGVEVLSQLIEHAGNTLSRNPASIAALEVPRYWLTQVLPAISADEAFGSRFAAALVEATREQASPECEPLLIEWGLHLGRTTHRLAQCRPVVLEMLRSRDHLFAEDRHNEAVWRTFLGGLLVAAAMPPNAMLPRPMLCQRLVEACPPVQQMSREQWKQASQALTKRLRGVLDERIFPELIACQSAVGGALSIAQQLDGLGNAEPDIKAWARARDCANIYRRWRQFVAASGQTFGMAHQAFIDVSQLNDWKLPDQTFVKLQQTLYRYALKSALAVRPADIRAGLLKRAAPPITQQQLPILRAQIADYAH